MMNIAEREKFNKKSGIYMVKNKIDKRLYVGAACDLYKRSSQHRRSLIANKHHSIFLQRFANKHGIDQLIFEVIELCERENLQAREQYYLDKYKSYKNEMGFNMCQYAYLCIGLKQSPETIKKRMAGRLGKPLSEEHKNKLREYKKGFNVPRHVIEASIKARKGMSIPDATNRKKAESLKRTFAIKYKELREHKIKNKKKRGAQMGRIVSKQTIEKILKTREENSARNDKKRIEKKETKRSEFIKCAFINKSIEKSELKKAIQDFFKVKDHMSRDIIDELVLSGRIIRNDDKKTYALA